MALLPILEFPDPRLRTIAKPVEKVDQSILTLVDDMFDTMYDAQGIGLAATQVNIHLQVIVIDVSEERNGDKRRVFINPKIEIIDREEFDYEEGCLSVPGFTEKVTRPQHVRVTYLDLEGKEAVMEPEGLLAVCIQHEMDHLQGKLFVDYLSSIKRQRIRKKLEKQHRLQA